MRTVTSFRSVMELLSTAKCSSWPICRDEPALRLVEIRAALAVLSPASTEPTSQLTAPYAREPSSASAANEPPPNVLAPPMSQTARAVLS